jgi:hypothetical protein
MYEMAFGKPRPTFAKRNALRQSLQEAPDQKECCEMTIPVSIFAEAAKVAQIYGTNL